MNAFSLWLPLVGSGLAGLLMLAPAAAAPAGAASPADAWKQAHPWVVPAPNREPSAYFSNLKNGEVVKSPFVVKLERRGAKPETADFRDGETETWLEPPAGDYQLRLELVGNGGESVLAAAPAVRVPVSNGRPAP